MNISTDISSVNTQAIGAFINIANKMPFMARRALTEHEMRDAALLRNAWLARKDVLNLTQDKAAALMGFDTQAAVSHYLNAKIPLNPSAKLKFADVLQMRPSEIWPSSRLDELRDDSRTEFNQFERESLAFARQLQALPKDDVRINIEGVFDKIKEQVAIKYVNLKRKQPRAGTGGPKEESRPNIRPISKRRTK